MATIPTVWRDLDDRDYVESYWRGNALSRADEAAEQWGIELPSEKPTAWRDGGDETEFEVYEFRYEKCVVQIRMDYDGAPDAKQTSKCVEIRIRGVGVAADGPQDGAL